MSELDDPGRSAALLRAMLASSLDAVVTIDAEGRVLMFNHAAEVTVGRSEGEALGRDVADLLIPPSLRERHRTAMARLLATGERTILNRRVEVSGMRSDGSEFPGRAHGHARPARRAAGVHRVPPRHHGA